jgi:hypothetical protein
MKLKEGLEKGNRRHVLASKEGPFNVARAGVNDLVSRLSGRVVLCSLCALRNGEPIPAV